MPKDWPGRVHVYDVPTREACMRILRRRMASLARRGQRVGEVHAMGIGLRPSDNGVSMAAAAAGDDRFRQLFPTVWEYLTATSWDDGKARTTSSLTCFFQDGVFKVMCHDKDLDRVVFVAGATIDEALARLEDDIATGKADWRKSQQNGKRRYR